MLDTMERHKDESPWVMILTYWESLREAVKEDSQSNFARNEILPKLKGQKVERLTRVYELVLLTAREELALLYPHFTERILQLSVKLD